MMIFQQHIVVLYLIHQKSQNIQNKKSKKFKNKNLKNNKKELHLLETFKIYKNNINNNIVNKCYLIKILCNNNYNSYKIILSSYKKCIIY